MTFFKKNFCQFRLQKWNKYILVALPIFTLFHPQTNEIQPFKVECFKTKMLKCQWYDMVSGIVLSRATPVLNFTMI